MTTRSAWEKNNYFNIYLHPHIYQDAISSKVLDIQYNGHNCPKYFFLSECLWRQQQTDKLWVATSFSHWQNILSAHISLVSVSFPSKPCIRYPLITMWKTLPSGAKSHKFILMLASHVTHRQTELFAERLRFLFTEGKIGSTGKASEPFQPLKCGCMYHKSRQGWGTLHEPWGRPTETGSTILYSVTDPHSGSESKSSLHMRFMAISLFNITIAFWVHHDFVLETKWTQMEKNRAKMWEDVLEGQQKQVIQ